MTSLTHTFKPGATYWTRSIGDHDCIYKITVASRSAKFLKTTEGKKLGVSVYEGVEQVRPHGTYSMAAIIGADRVALPVDPVERQVLTDCLAAERANGRFHEAEKTARAIAELGLVRAEPDAVETAEPAPAALAANEQGYDVGVEATAKRDGNPFAEGTAEARAWAAGFEQGAQTRREMAA